MSQLETLTAAIEKLQKSNLQLLSKIEDKSIEPEFITTGELKKRWCCTYELINAQMKEGLPYKKPSKTKLLFNFSVIKKWEEDNF